MAHTGLIGWDEFLRDRLETFTRLQGELIARAQRTELLVSCPRWKPSRRSAGAGLFVTPSTSIAGVELSEIWVSYSMKMSLKLFATVVAGNDTCPFCCIST